MTLRIPFLPPQSRASCLRGWLLPVCVLLILTTVQAHAQGCAQCLDSTRTTPPAVQAAYRHAIELLGGVGATLFLAGLYLFRRNP